MIEKKTLRFLTFLTLSMMVFIATGLTSMFTETTDDLELNQNLTLDFSGFTKKVTIVEVILNGKKYRAKILDENYFEGAKEECEESKGRVSWNRVEELAESEPTSYWIEIGNQTDFNDRNLREVNSEVLIILSGR